MKISVVIPVYNAEKYVEQCVTSALEQSYSNIEVIAVDDGSTDDSQEILQGFSDKISVFKKPNGGTSSALNYGFRQMTGDWFKWLSADDLLKSNAIQTLADSVNQTSEAANCIFYANYEIIDEDGNKIDDHIEDNNDNLSNFERNVLLLDRFYGNGTTSMIHKSVFAKCGLFDETVGYKEDYEFWLRCCLLHGCRMRLVNENIAKYRMHFSQLTQRRYNDALEQISHIKSLVLDRLPDDQRIKYVNALKKYEKTKPASTRIRRMLRNSMFRFLPKSTSDKILKTYLNNKKKNQLGN